MKFNIQKFLVKNKLTKRSLLNEDDNTGAMLKTDAEQEEMSDEEEFDLTSIDPYGGEYNKDEWGNNAYTRTFPDRDDEKEPTAANMRVDRTTKDLHSKQAKLQDLENQKDALLMQLRSGQLSLDQYKQSIGNIPSQIKKLRADIEKAMNVTTDDDSEVQS